MTQNERIAKYLKSGKRLTPAMAEQRFGCTRLAARIYELRHNERMTIDNVDGAYVLGTKRSRA